MSFSDALRRAPAFAILLVSLVVFGVSAVIFALPYDAAAADGTTVECGPPFFEAVASDNARPTITVPSTSPGARPSTTTTLHPFLQMFTTTTLPPPTTAAPTTVDEQTLTKEACGTPANRRLLLGGAGMALAVGLGYVARTLGLRTEEALADGDGDGDG